MENLIKNLHTFVSIAMKKPCVDLAPNLNLDICYIGDGDYFYDCANCIFKEKLKHDSTKDALSVIKIIGEHSERTD